MGLHAMKRACLGPAPRVPCPYRALTSQTRCEPCGRERERQRSAAPTAFERRIYDGIAWQRLRAQVCAEAGGRCEALVYSDSGPRRCNDYPVTGGHIIPVRQRPDLGLVRSNVRAECRRHQNLSRGREPGAVLPR